MNSKVVYLENYKNKSPINQEDNNRQLKREKMKKKMTEKYKNKK